MASIKSGCDCRLYLDGQFIGSVGVVEFESVPTAASCIAGPVCRAADAIVEFTMRFREACGAIEAAIDAAYSIAAREYLSEHKRLPGSSRTSRLRKKRRHRVLDWYFKKKHCELRPAFVQAGD